MESHDLLSNELQINGVTESNFLEAARWGKFVAIVGFIFCGLMAIGGIAIATYVANLQGSSYYSSSYLSTVKTTMMIIYIIFAIILFFPYLFLYRFSVKMQQGIKSTSQETFDSSVQNLKAMFRYIGILSIIFLAFMALSLLGTIMR